MLRKIAFLVMVLVLVMTNVPSIVLADKPAQTGNAQSNAGCDTIQSGNIKDSAGNVIGLGYDQFGYNYQAHMFNGTYDSSDRTIDGMYWGDIGDYVDDSLIMKWSDDWLSNVDCNHDGKLDRGLVVNGVPDDISKGWLTNQVNGDYDTNSDGTQDAHFTQFDKIVWVGPGGSLWGQYEIIQEIINDPNLGLHGLQIKIGAPGFGLNDHWTTN